MWRTEVKPVFSNETHLHFDPLEQLVTLKQNLRTVSRPMNIQCVPL